MLRLWTGEAVSGIVSGIEVGEDNIISSPPLRCTR
ncbi:L-arginine responsive protein LaoB [Escherichia albertii]